MKTITIFPMLCVAIFLLYFMGNSTNHTGMEFLIFFWIIVVCAVVSAIEARKNRYFLIPLLVNVLAAAFFYTIDHLNIMVEYDRWIYRGMPEPFEPSRQKKIDISPEIFEYSRLTLKQFEEGKITREEFDRASEHIANEIKKSQENFYRKEKNVEKHSTE